ncbi:response regulator [uncultured Massilia sp.]|uniref:response regulator n=1 Tax=uncultured Massilia sp. TaxID=169973 RepID=UPI002600CA41|nr:response regulator [uncultured Massilia sp.]
MKVLIVDDDVVSRMMLMHMIDGAGHGADVREAEDGEQAWRQLEDGADPAILFCDLRMPRLSGMELLARVKADARFAHLPFVLVSAASDAATMEQALGLGAAGYIVKPFDGVGVAEHLARLAPCDDGEEAGAVARRLGIDTARLQLYLGGLQRQLAGAVAELEALLAGGRPQAARDLLARLAEGCRTLGLRAPAGGLNALAAGADLDGAAAARMLEQAGAAAARQAEAARALAD